MKNEICIMDDVREDFLGSPHGTIPGAVIANKIKLRFFKGSEHINVKNINIHVERNH